MDDTRIEMELGTEQAQTGQIRSSHLGSKNDRAASHLSGYRAAFASLEMSPFLIPSLRITCVKKEKHLGLKRLIERAGERAIVAAQPGLDFWTSHNKRREKKQQKKNGREKGSYILYKSPTPPPRDALHKIQASISSSSPSPLYRVHTRT